jgi:pSer/pThr/pTyr-binding forkhead associated (FHA) protein
MGIELSQDSDAEKKYPELKVILGPDADKIFPITAPVVTLGRGKDRDIQFTDRAMSRKHCEIAKVENKLIIRDTKSHNGIKVNGRLTLERELKDGDQVDIGSTRLIVSIPS